MATIDFSKHNGKKDIYNEGDIEDVLYSFYHHGGQGIIDYGQSFFYTTPIRQNIVNWYPFRPNATILEIGGGCGPVTTALLPKAKKVVSIESSKRRAKILYERHKSANNLEILCGNFNDMHFKEKFDYIVLVGVFEYAPMFFQSEDPFREFLNQMLACLKPDGVILIAIENKLGIKYLAGLSEDHNGRPYIGLEGYIRECNPPRTFGHQEWANLLDSVGLKYQFYGVFPDYKLPSFIFNEKATVSNAQVSNLSFWNMYNDSVAFDTNAALRSFNNNGLMFEVSNSFFIEIGHTNRHFSNYNFVYFPNYRSKNTYVATILSDRTVKKIPLNQAAISHLDRLVNTHNILSKAGLKCCKITIKHGEYLCEKISGQSLGELAEEYVRVNQPSQAARCIIDFIEMLRQHTKTVRATNLFSDDLKVFGEKIRTLPVSSLDMSLYNAIQRPNGQVVLIDQEWTTDAQLPFEYCIYSTVDLFYTACPAMAQFYPKTYFYNKYGLDSKKLRVLKNVRDKYHELNGLTGSPQADWVNARARGKVLIDEDSGNEVYANTQAGEVKYYRDKYHLYRDGYQDLINRYNTRYYRACHKIYGGINRLLPQGSIRKKAINSALTHFAKIHRLVKGRNQAPK